MKFQIKKVAFDLGNVVYKVDIEGFISKLVSIGIFNSITDGLKFIDGIQASQDLGLCDIESALRLHTTGIKESKIYQAADCWRDVIAPCPEMMAFLSELLSSGFQVALLSNIGHDHAHIIKANSENPDCLEYNVINKCIQHFSCDVGARKPNKLFYQSFALANDWPKSVLFFDDRMENIEGADGFFKGIHFDLNNPNWSGTSQAVDFLRKTILE